MQAPQSWVGYQWHVGYTLRVGGEHGWGLRQASTEGARDGGQASEKWTDVVG